MKAIVCDKCGKVILLEDIGKTYGRHSGVYRLINTSSNTELDLCEECADSLMAAVRKE